MSDQSELSGHAGGGVHSVGDDGSSRINSPRVEAGPALLATGQAATGGGVSPLPIIELQDMNPLGPCGACLEWLKKLAEVNPDFRVVMFEDTSCSNVFVRSVFGVNMIG